MMVILLLIALIELDLPVIPKTSTTKTWPAPRPAAAARPMSTRYYYYCGAHAAPNNHHQNTPPWPNNTQPLRRHPRTILRPHGCCGRPCRHHPPRPSIRSAPVLLLLLSVVTLIKLSRGLCKTNSLMRPLLIVSLWYNQ